MSPAIYSPSSLLVGTPPLLVSPPVAVLFGIRRLEKSTSSPSGLLEGTPPLLVPQPCYCLMIEITSNNTNTNQVADRNH